MKIQNAGFDHVEFIVDDLQKHAQSWQRMGFEKVGARKLAKRGLQSELWAQGLVRILLTKYESAASIETGAKFHKAHGDGISVLAVDVDNATQAFEETVKRGAKVALEPVRYESAEGSVVRAEIYTPTDLRYAFIERKATKSDKSSPALFDEGLVAARLQSPSPANIILIDHLTNNVGIGEMPMWVEWYKTVFGFTVTRHFDIRTGRTGLTSDVVQSADGKIIVPINQATEPESQVQEFCDRFKGPGVQHLALQTTDIIPTLKHYRNSGFKFLTIPHTYYEEVPKRVAGVTENLTVLEELSILLDGDTSGYLLQIFSEELVGPFFLELIQRKGNKGFGEGNFRALFEAIERDQVRRGVLKRA